MSLPVRVCVTVALVLALGRLFDQDRDQRPTRMRCDPILSRVARARALDRDDPPDRAWRTWLQSRPHRAQVLGLSPRVAEQTDYGVGYAQVPASPFRHYWVLITARH